MLSREKSSHQTVPAARTGCFLKSNTGMLDAEVGRDV